MGCRSIFGEVANNVDGKHQGKIYLRFSQSLSVNRLLKLSALHTIRFDDVIECKR